VAPDQGREAKAGGARAFNPRGATRASLKSSTHYPSCFHLGRPARQAIVKERPPKAFDAIGNCRNEDATYYIKETTYNNQTYWAYRSQARCLLDNSLLSSRLAFDGRSIKCHIK
jgi:hypothetical protein